MRAPLTRDYQPDANVRQRIATYFVLVIGGRKNVVVKHLPTIMPSWGKMRIRHGGDSIRTTTTPTTRRSLRDPSKPGRNNCFVRVSASFMIVIVC